jgi:hypothetical protein
VATGTDGRDELPAVASVVLADCLAEESAEARTKVRLSAVDQALDVNLTGTQIDPENEAFVTVYRPENEVRLLGLEPKTYGLKGRCLSEESRKMPSILPTSAS